MSLYTKIVLAALIPLGTFFMLEIFTLQRVITNFDVALHDKFRLKAENVERNIQRVLQQMETASAVLSKSTEISNALQRADNNVLYDFSTHFITPVDHILFADTQGIVISRAPDEFRFGDDISATTHFQETLNKEAYYGIVHSNTGKRILIGQSIKKYDDVSVGVVLVSVDLSRLFLQEMIGKDGMILEVQHEGIGISSSDSNQPIIHSFPLGNIFKPSAADTSQVIVHFIEDENYLQLLALKQIAYAASIAMIIIALVLLLLVLRRNLKPISSIVDYILSYSSNRIDAEEFRQKLNSLKTSPHGIADRISKALVGMLVVIRDNFKHIEEVNANLSNTVADLEKNIKEVKTLRGLLPICARCKKIRDDKGYWNNLESYVEENSEAFFSHGTCPECEEELYGDTEWYQKMKQRRT